MKWLVARTHYLRCNWATAQRIANFNRRQGHKVHVCQLSEAEHVLWPAR